MKVAISIPDPIFEAADELAQRQGKSRSRLYAEAVAEYLQFHRGDAVRDQLNAVYATENASLPTELDHMQRHSLDSDDW